VPPAGRSFFRQDGFAESRFIKVFFAATEQAHAIWLAAFPASLPFPTG
jgi:hypothetical protein